MQKCNKRLLSFAIVQESRIPRLLLNLSIGLLAFGSIELYADEAQGPTLPKRTHWQMHDGLGAPHDAFDPLPEGIQPRKHGDPVTFQLASIPPADHPDWGPTPHGDILNYRARSVITGPCGRSAEFTYFQTFLDVPSETTPTNFTLEYSMVDDGVRVTIFNSKFPDGVEDENSYITHGEKATGNLANFLAEGDRNRLVVTLVDDCKMNKSLLTSRIYLDGSLIASNHPPTVTISNSVVKIKKGNTAVNSGTYSDPDPDDDVKITATAGKITKTGTNQGTWSWSTETSDKSLRQQVVHVLANDKGGDNTSSGFRFYVRFGDRGAGIEAVKPREKGSASKPQVE